jgi:hypothetical protein
VVTTWSAGITAAACAEPLSKILSLIEIFFLLKKEKLTGTRLTHSLFAKRFRFDKSSLRRGSTPDLFLTLSRLFQEFPLPQKPWTKN